MKLLFWSNFYLVAASISYFGDKVYRFDTSKDSYRSQVNALIQDYHEVIVWKDSKDHVDIQVPAILLKKVQRNIRVPHVTLIENVQEKIDREQSSFHILEDAAFFTTYKSGQEYIDYMTTLNGAQKFSIGTTYEGKDIPGVKIGTGKVPVVINGGIHAREWISPITVTYFADFLASTDIRAQQLLSKFVFHLIPVLNPDGYEFTRTDNRMWRKNREPNTGTDCVGTDINRNFEFKWSGSGASSSKCSETYYGPSALSTREASSLDKYVRSIRPRVYLDVHSYGQMWLYPWY